MYNINHTFGYIFSGTVYFTPATTLYPFLTLDNSSVYNLSSVFFPIPSTTLSYFPRMLSLSVSPQYTLFGPLFLSVIHTSLVH